MEFVRIVQGQVELLQDFINNIGEAGSSFRYFQKRDTSAINQHVITLVATDKNKPVAYGHLDRDGENVWLGICVLPAFQGKGYGRKMMTELIEQGKKSGVKKIVLTVDKHNESAITLYEWFGFRVISQTDLYYKYSLELES